MRLLVPGRVAPLVLLAAVIAAPPAIPADDRPERLLPSEVEAILKRQRLGERNAGLYIAWADGTPIAVLNPDRAFNPASSAKLLTSMAALDLLGPTHTWRSELLSEAKVVDGVLQGDIYFRGNGDPFLTVERAMHLVAGLNRRGIHAIAGDIVIDDSAFSLPTHDPAEFDGKGNSLYNAPPGAAVINFNATKVVVRYDGKVSVFLDPPSTTFEVVNKIKPRRASCRGNWRRRLKESLHRDPDGTARLTLHGTYPTGCGETSFFLLGQSDPVAHAAGVIGGLLELFGGEVRGSWRAGEVPKGARTYASSESSTLAEVIRGMNKHSNNFMARNIFLSLGVDKKGTPSTLESSRAAIDEWFVQLGIDTAGLFVDNGSGLSRTTRATPRQFGEALLDFNARPYRHELIASLAVLARDGTARRWNRKGAAAGAAHIKTGTLSGARSTVGVVHNPAGDIIFVALAETRATARARVAIQRLLDWAHGIPAPTPVSAPVAAK